MKNTFWCTKPTDGRYKIKESLISIVERKLEILKKEDRGIYRKIPVQIIGSLHKPVQPYLIIPRMEELLHQYKNSNEDIITKLARFHLEFESIHLFIDGNGRTGRLLINLELMKAGYPPIDIKFKDRLEYYEAFNDFHRKHNVSKMLNMFAKYLNQRLDLYLSILDN